MAKPSDASVALFVLNELSQSVQTALTECHRLSGLTNKHFFLSVLEAQKFKTKVLADLISGESCFLIVAVFSL